MVYQDNMLAWELGDVRHCPVPHRSDSAKAMVKLRHDGIQQETDQALLVLYHGHEVWVPKSQCERRSDDLLVPQWLRRLKVQEVETVEGSVDEQLIDEILGGQR